MKRRIRFSFLFVTGLLVTGALASAATISGTCSTVALTPTELSGTVSCSDFNNALGTLTSIQLTLDGNIAGSITLVNNGGNTQTGSGTTNSAFDLGAAFTGFGFPTPLFTASYTTGPQTLGAGATMTFSGLTGTGSVSETDTTGSTFSGYEGVGNFSIPVSTVTGLSITGGGGNFGGSQSTQAGATAEVVYTYTPLAGTVPEPSTAVFLGTGALGLAIGLLRRRSA